MNQPLHLPLSVIERILSFALGGVVCPAGPATCVTPISPPVGLSHLLLVSKEFSALALPLYWRSVTVLRSDDWVKLWGAKQGLLVGPTGKARAGWVQEIRINLADRAALPLNLAVVLERPYVDDGYDSHGLHPKAIVQLKLAQLSGLKYLILFDSAVGWESDEAAGRLGPGDEPWQQAAWAQWEETQEERYEDHRADRSVGVFQEDSDEEQDDWDNWEDGDADVYGYEHEARMKTLDRRRHARIAEILRLDKVRLISVCIISSKVDRTGHAIISHIPLERRPRIIIFWAAGDVTGRLLKSVVLDKESLYWFFGVPLAIQSNVAAEFVRHYGLTAVKRWGWLGRAGGPIPLAT